MSTVGLLQTPKGFVCCECGDPYNGPHTCNPNYKMELSFKRNKDKSTTVTYTRVKK